MNKPTGIFWLASYPKSGNTWFRVFLANMLKAPGKTVELNHLQTGMIASDREWIDDTLGFESHFFSDDELDRLRPAIYDWYGSQQIEASYHKIHDAYTFIDEEQPLIPSNGCLGALYFIRNPLDVAISFANHSNSSIDQAITNMGNPQFGLCKNKSRQDLQVRQKLLSWSMHVNSWAKARDIQVQVLRYEDMKLSPIETFTTAVRFLKLDATTETIEQAISDARFDKLKDQETKSGFREKPSGVKQFFRKGIVGDWQKTLTEQQVQRIIGDHGTTMQAFGYLDAKGNPILPA